MYASDSESYDGDRPAVGPELPTSQIGNDIVMKGKKCEFKAYRHMKKKDGSTSVQVTEEPFKQLGSIDEQDSSFALIINRFFNEKNVLEKSTIRINSFWILKAMREVVVSYPGVSSDFKTPFELDSPYQLLLHAWEKLEERRSATSDPDERMHLNLLFEFMDSEIGEQRATLLEMIRQNHITFGTAWYLYRPGVLLYSEFKGCPHLFRCKRTFYEASTQKGPYIDIVCTYTDHDGDNAGQATHYFTIYQKQTFGGDQAALIDKLPVFPFSAAGKDDEFLDRIRKRGETFLSLQDRSVVEYDGNTQYLRQVNQSVYDPEMGSWGAVWLPYTESGRLILDRKSFHEDMWYAHNIEVDKTKVDPLLCPPYTYAYSVAHKQWCRPLLDRIVETQWKQGVWETLIVPDKERQVLRALVSSHSYPDKVRDQTKQKGKGSSSSCTGALRALITASLGELDRENKLSTFQFALKNLLRLATVWKAVVLLDEADVLLEVRDDNQTSRNAMVAIFLHELEYFSGIIFLTTNRVETFDKAMKSRIHLSLGYTPPTAETRRQIWLQKLRAVPADEMGIDLTEAAAAAAAAAADDSGGAGDRRRLDDTILSNNLNGREISNVVNTARTLARYEGRKVVLEHIESILGVHAAFLQNLAATKSVDDEKSFEPKAIRRQNSILED